MLARAASGIVAVAVTAGLVASLMAGGGSALGGATGGGRPDATEPTVSVPGEALSPEPIPTGLDGLQATDAALIAAAPIASAQAGVSAAGPTGGAAGRPVPLHAVAVVRRFPHDSQAFTQGLIWRDGALYESVGREGRSEVRRVALDDGRVLARAPIPADQFGEGLAANGAELVSLTWKNGVAHRWDARTLQRRGAFAYTGEGWGLAGDGRELALSDGTPTLRFMDPRGFRERRRVTVTFQGRPVTDLNEIEWIDGQLWGNIWHQPFLVRIDPATGRVTAVADLRPLVREVNAADPEAVANGIAWDAKSKRLFVTGKLWPTLFEVKLTPAG